MVTCRDCWKFLRGECSLIYEVEEVKKAYKEAKTRSLRLDETKQEYYQEIKKQRILFCRKRKEQFKCFNKREFLYQNLGYPLFKS